MRGTLGSGLAKSTRSTPDDSGHLDRLSTSLLIVFGLGIAAMMLVLRVNASPDMAVVLVGVLAVVIGRGVRFLRDWAPFLAVFMAWELMRGIANQFGAAVHAADVVALERALFGGVPTVQLQHLLWSGSPGPLDYALTLVYVSHFALPIGVAFALWLHQRQTYYRFVTTLMIVSYAAFVTFLLLPVAPPRFATDFGAPLPVVDIGAAVTKQLGWHGFVWTYSSLVGNPVAAFPSMHAAYPVIAFLFLWPRWRAAGIGMAVWGLAVWFAVVYLGHHYIVDIIGGVLYAVAGFLAVRAWDAWRRRRTSTEPQTILLEEALTNAAPVIGAKSSER